MAYQNSGFCLTLFGISLSGWNTSVSEISRAHSPLLSYCSNGCFDKKTRKKAKNSKRLNLIALDLLWSTLDVANVLMCEPLFSAIFHDDVIKWKHFPRYWPFVRGIHRSPVISPQKGQWRGALMFSLMCGWISAWANNRDAGDLRRHRAHYDVRVMQGWHHSFLAIHLENQWASSTGLTAVSIFKPRLHAQWAVGIHHKGLSRMEKELPEWTDKTRNFP